MHFISPYALQGWRMQEEKKAFWGIVDDSIGKVLVIWKRFEWACSMGHKWF